jgi:hypothetical protein
MIELSIVLVIIGLVSGAIFVGQELMSSAEIRATAAQINSFETAVNTFKLKYGCLPGDCDQAAAFGFIPISAGNGDEIIGRCSYAPDCMNSATDHEYVNFWYHLSASNLIPYSIPAYSIVTVTEAGIASPPLKINPISHTSGFSSGWAIAADLAYAISGGGNTTLPSHNWMTATDAVVPDTYPPSYKIEDIARIDEKLDDGLPLSGTIVAWNSFIANALPPFNRQYFVFTGNPGGTNVAACVRSDTTPAQYNILYAGNSGLGLCGLIIRAGF